MTIADRRALVADGCLSVPEAAKFCSLSERMLYDLLASKTLLGVRMGKRWGVPRRALVEFMAERIAVS